ncbi:MAG: YdiU family protein [Rhodocyclaceae bacterium]
MTSLNFDNRFIRELPGDPLSDNRSRQVRGACWSSVAPTAVAAPSLLAWSPEMAASLDLDEAALRSPALLAALAGNALLPGMQSYATCYGGHQFGNWAGQLGDGRAIALGEVVSRTGQRWELQLKGAGPTPYSRRADGRAVLRSSIREFLCSEAMHHLGVPTTRALSLVGSGEAVRRDMFYDGNAADEPGAIVCRVAPSFTRFGHFEILAARGETALLRRLVDFTISRDFPEFSEATGVAAAPGGTPDALIAAWFAEVCARTATLLVHWMRVGFVHGVMNTDNMSILGLTIDYGPYGWVDNFDPGWTPNTTDAAGKRYCFGRQPEIARWNLERLADALSPLLADPAQLAAGLERYDTNYANQATQMFAQKFGIDGWQDSDAELINDVFDLMQQAEVDMTIFFRQLALLDIDAVTPDLLAAAFYRDELRVQFTPAFALWLQRYAARLRRSARPAGERQAMMNRVNPRFVLRNYLAQQAIERAEQGDPGLIHTLLEVLRRPYDEQPAHADLAGKRPEWARHKAGCSMLSCSS